MTRINTTLDGQTIYAYLVGQREATHELLEEGSLTGAEQTEYEFRLEEIRRLLRGIYRLERNAANLTT